MVTISNSWHISMYDHMFAENTLNSEGMKVRARQEVEFLISVLNLPLGASILDVPCGTGRHSQIFAEHGHKVLGLDINTSCLEIANKELINGVKYKIGNMLDLSAYRNQFDCVVNLFSSFGYFSTDDENEVVLKQMTSALRYSGKLVINLVNRDFLLSIYKPSFWFKNGSILTVSAGSYNHNTHYNESYITLKNEATNETSLSYHRIRLYSADEIIDLMKKNGLVDIQVYGDFLGSKFDKYKSTHPFFVGTKI